MQNNSFPYKARARLVKGRTRSVDQTRAARVWSRRSEHARALTQVLIFFALIENPRPWVFNHKFRVISCCSCTNFRWSDHDATLIQICNCASYNKLFCYWIGQAASRARLVVTNIMLLCIRAREPFITRARLLQIRKIQRLYHFCANARVNNKELSKIKLLRYYLGYLKQLQESPRIWTLHSRKSCDSPTSQQHSVMVVIVLIIHIGLNKDNKLINKKRNKKQSLSISLISWLLAP